MTRSIVFGFLMILIAGLPSCRKGPGVGGKATITGKVYQKEYNSTFTVLLSEYYKADHDVYIVYGDDNVYSDKVSTHYDGTFEFNYLLPGVYTIYIYSEDKTGVSASGDVVVEREVEITEKKEVITLDDMITEEN